MCPDSKVHGANMGPIWVRQDPDGPHVGPMNFAICLGYASQTLTWGYMHKYTYTNIYELWPYHGSWFLPSDVLLPRVIGAVTLAYQWSLHWYSLMSESGSDVIVVESTMFITVLFNIVVLYQVTHSVVYRPCKHDNVIKWKQSKQSRHWWFETPSHSLSWMLRREPNTHIREISVRTALWDVTFVAFIVTMGLTTCSVETLFVHYL